MVLQGNKQIIWSYIMVSKEEIAQIINFSINNIQGKCPHSIVEMEEMLTEMSYDNG